MCDDVFVDFVIESEYYVFKFYVFFILISYFIVVRNLGLFFTLLRLVDTVPVISTVKMKSDEFSK